MEKIKKTSNHFCTFDEMSPKVCILFCCCSTLSVGWHRNFFSLHFAAALIFITTVEESLFGQN